MEEAAGVVVEDVDGAVFVAGGYEARVWALWLMLAYTHES